MSDPVQRALNHSSPAGRDCEQIRRQTGRCAAAGQKEHKMKKLAELPEQRCDDFIIGILFRMSTLYLHMHYTNV